jgi:23S rRNA (cytidine2498-2'-O)-methyltransferase
MIASAYLAAEEFSEPLAEELVLSGRRVSAWHGRLALSPDPPAPSAWALEVWTAPQEIDVASVKSAADALRGIQRNWALYGAAHHRRCALIEERLPPVKARPLAFPEPAPTAHLGAWTLLTPDRMLASATKTSPFVNGAVQFVEDKEGPPSRAYLKLWEALTRLGAYPGPGDRCLDLGAAPGGWSWALAKLGAQVVAVDKAPIEAAVLAMPGVTQRLESAFGLEPRDERRVDWLFSDVICYPARLLALVQRWIAAEAARNFVCTIKFQGTTDHAMVAEFAAIPGARLFHGAHNKHELTFARLSEETRR